MKNPYSNNFYKNYHENIRAINIFVAMNQTHKHKAKIYYY